MDLITKVKMCIYTIIISVGMLLAMEIGVIQTAPVMSLVFKITTILGIGYIIAIPLSLQSVTETS